MWIRMSLVILIFTAVQSLGQSTPPRLVNEIDLRPLGLRVPPKNQIPWMGMEILFISEDHLVVFCYDSPPPFSFPQSGRLLVYEVVSGRTLSERLLNRGEIGPGNSSFRAGPDYSIQRVSEDEFAIGTPKGIQLCDASLRCKPGIQVSGRFHYSPDGRHVIIGPKLPSKRTSWAIYDGAGTTTASFSEDAYQDFQISNSGVYFSSSSGARFYPMERNVPVQLSDCGGANFIGVIGDWRILCLMRKNPIVGDELGRRIYRLNLNKLPWDTELVASAGGSKFGLEWKSNTWKQLLNPLACIDECPETGRERFYVFSSENGKLLASFQWDPRPNNLYVLPALSPSAKLAAFVNKDRLMIYSLDER